MYNYYVSKIFIHKNQQHKQNNGRFIWFLLQTHPKHGYWNQSSKWWVSGIFDTLEALVSAQKRKISLRNAHNSVQNRKKREQILKTIKQHERDDKEAPA